MYCNNNLTVLTIYNLITCRLFSVTRSARYGRGDILPHSARHSGRLGGVTIVSHSVRCRFATMCRPSGEYAAHGGVGVARCGPPDPQAACSGAYGRWLMAHGHQRRDADGTSSPTGGRHHAAFGGAYGRWLMAYGYRQRDAAATPHAIRSMACPRMITRGMFPLHTLHRFHDGISCQLSISPL